MNEEILRISYDSKMITDVVSPDIILQFRTNPVRDLHRHSSSLLPHP